LRRQDRPSNVGRRASSFDPELDLATWESARPSLPRLMRDPELGGRLAYHFARIATVDRLTIQQSAMSAASPIRESGRSSLAADAKALT
jgi:hypothetical protein